MVTSPIGKGVIISGGYTNYPARQNFHMNITSNDVYELSGNSLESLEWTLLEQKLQYPRISHASFPIPDDVSENLHQYETQKAKAYANRCTLM